MRERSALIEGAAQWMAGRRWRAKRAKRRDYEQSLYEHSLIELDVLLELLPILTSPRHYGLSETEQRILLVAVPVHDVAKETDAWQAYVGGGRDDEWVSHIIPELTKAVVPEVCAALGFEDLSGPVQSIMGHCATFHHSRPGRSDAAIMEAMLTGGSDRFLTLATLVKALDHFCSAAGAAKAEEAATGDPALGSHLTVTRHEVSVRGVSTVFLHEAARAAYQEQGWKPLLYFSSATVYGADPNEHPAIPTADQIRAALKAEIDAAIARDVRRLMVGSPTGNILPKPDLFSFDESRQYLETAAKKIGSQSLARKPLKDKRRVVQTYWALKAKDRKPTDEEVEREAGQISVAQPEMLVFKFFKAMVDPEKLPSVGDGGAARAKALYEQRFGLGSWADLQSTSTLSAAADMAKTVDRYWELPGSAVGCEDVARVSELPNDERLRVLVRVLDEIAREAYGASGEPSPRDQLASNMAAAFVNDLIRPVVIGDVRKVAEQQLIHYGSSKPFAGRESSRGTYLCPTCNVAFGAGDGITASADFIDNPQTHTNRGVALGRFGYVVICKACYFERLLLQVLMGGRPAEVITLLPRMNIGPGMGQRLVSRVAEWVEGAKRLMRGEGGSVELGFSLGFVNQAASHLGDRDPFALEPGELLSVFSFRFRGETQKTRRREALRRLKEEFDERLDNLKTAVGEPFTSWEEAVEALIEGKVVQQEFVAIRREVFRLYETVHLVCRTPNLIFIPLSYEIAGGDDESDASKGLRRLYVSLVLSLVFDAAVAIHKQGEPIDFSGVAGAAYVPPIPAIRSLVGYGWLPMNEAKRWLAAIGAASQLAKDAGFSKRSAIYQILVADPAERIARRIEENLSNERGSITPNHLRLIEALPGFRGKHMKEASS